MEDKDKTFLDRFIDKYFLSFDKVTPNLYTITEKYLYDALAEEIDTYNFSSAKKEYMTLALEGSLAAALKYDENLKVKLEAATTEEEKKRIIKEYMRNFLREEVDLQIANAKREIRNNIVQNKIKEGNNVFALFDPRFKGKDKEARFSQYEEYRQNVADYLYPSLGGNEVTTPLNLNSDLTSSLNDFVKEWNERSPAEKSLGTSFVSFGATTSKASRKLLEDDLNQTFLKKFENVTSDYRVFDSVTGKFLHFSDLAILSNISKEAGDLGLIKKGISEREKIALVEFIKNGDIASASKYFNLSSGGKTANQIAVELAKISQFIKIDEDGNAKTVGKDALKSIFESSLDRFGDRVKKNGNEAITDIHNSYLNSNIATLKSLFYDGKAADTSDLSDVLSRNSLVAALNGYSETLKKVTTLSDTERDAFAKAKLNIIKAVTDGVVKFEDDKEKAKFLSALKDDNESVIKSIVTPKLLLKTEAASQIKDLLQRNELASNIINYTKSIKKFSSLSSSDQTTVSQIKLNILKAVADGVFNFDNEQQKADFINAVNSGNYSYLNKFISPGLLGTGVFSRFLKDTNEKTLQLAGKIGSKELASRSLNFDSHTRLFQNQTLQNYIYVAQLAFDQGYLVKEIKSYLKIDKIQEIWKKLDTKITWELVSKQATKGFLSFVTNKNIFGKFAASGDDIQRVLDFYSGKISFGGLAKNYLLHQINKRVNLSQIAKNLNLLVKFKFQNLISGFTKSKFAQQLRNKLLKNSKYLEKAFGFILNRFAPGAGGLVSKFIKYGGSYLSRFAGTFFGNFSNSLSKFFQGRFDPEEFQKLLVKIALSFIALIFIFLSMILAPMQVIMGALNSLSQSTTNQSDFGGPVSLVPDATIVGSGIFTSGNACVGSDGLPKYTRLNKNWNNLNISDFEGTRNNKNCNIMCNAKTTMGRMFLGSDSKTIDCNAMESIYNTKDGGYNEFYCTDLVLRSYADDDEGIKGKRLVIDMDAYLSDYSGSSNSKYIKTDLAEPSPASNLSEYKPNCIPLDKINPGNIIIYRVNTCNDVNYYKTYFNAEKGANETRLVYDTYRTGTTDKIAVFGAHTELVLKVADEGATKVVYTMSTNNTLKKLTYRLQSCGNDTYSFQVAKGWGSLRGEAYANGDSYPCRMYELRNASGGTCAEDCHIGPNNYPDKDNYPSEDMP